MKVKEYGEFDVAEDRSQYIGGSDIPVIMGISTFKRRFDLLLEKAGLQENPFKGNRYTEYGHTMEPIIRNHINQKYGIQFIPNRVIEGDIRYHSDGYSDERNCVLEVKTTSDIHSSVYSYKSYLVQLAKGMEMNEAANGILAVYHRPEDFSTDFDPERLQIFFVYQHEVEYIQKKVNEEVDKFRVDLSLLKENPLLSEQDFLPADTSLVTVANKVIAFENQLAELKDIEQQCKEAKKQLFLEMVKHGVDSWVLPNGTKITQVKETPATTKMVTEFDTEAFKADNPTMYQRYVHEVEKHISGKSGYVRITVPKG